MRSFFLLSVLGVLLLLSSCGTAPDTTGAVDEAAASVDSESSTEKQPDQTWFTAYPSLKKYGIEILESPREGSVGHEIVIAVSAAADVEIDAAVWRPGSTSSISGAAQGEKTSGTWRYTVTFPDTLLDNFPTHRCGAVPHGRSLRPCPAAASHTRKG